MNAIEINTSSIVFAIPKLGHAKIFSIFAWVHALFLVWD